MFIILGFYKFKNLKSLKKNKLILQKLFIDNNIKGILIISNEGLNGTISGKYKNIFLTSKKIKSLFGIVNFDSENLSKSKFQPFHKPRVKIKKEVVPMGLNISAKNKKTNYVEPLKWNNLIKDKNTFVLDVRKPFEYEVGSFKKAVNPKVNHFREFPEYLNKLDKKKPVAMFCTGGIRCEKASAYLNDKGFKNIFLCSFFVYTDFVPHFRVCRHMSSHCFCRWNCFFWRRLLLSKVEIDLSSVNVFPAKGDAHSTYPKF